MNLTREQVIEKLKKYYDLFDQLENAKTKRETDQIDRMMNKMLNALEKELNAPYLSDYIYWDDNTPETCADAVIKFWKDGIPPEVEDPFDEDDEEDDFEDDEE